MKKKKQHKVEKTQRIRREETKIGEIAHTSSNRSGLRKRWEIILHRGEVGGEGFWLWIETMRFESRRREEEKVSGRSAENKN